MKRESIFLTLWILGGIILTTSGWMSLRSAEQLVTDRNPFAVQRSAYGKLLARLSETTIDRVWHMGVENVAPHSHDGDGHDHGHHGHSHEGGHESPESHDDEHDHICEGVEKCEHVHDDAHSHESAIELADHDHSSTDEDAFEYNVADGDLALAVSDEDRAAQAEGYHCATCKKMELAQKAMEFKTDSPFIPQAKEFLGHLSALKIVRTNPTSMSEAHLTWAKQQVESQLLRSYKMDPTHYGVYNSYHLFLTTHALGGNDASRKQAELIANHTIACVFQEKEDPEPWLTAAAATMNLYIMRTQSFQVSGEKVPVDILREYQSKIGFCLSKFSELHEKADKAGIWANLSLERQLEIAEHARFANRTFEPFEAMIARAEARERGYNTPEAEIAEILSFDGLSE